MQRIQQSWAAESTESVTRMLRQSKAQNKKILEKLEQIEASQQTILTQMETVLEELQIVKIRATMR